MKKYDGLLFGNGMTLNLIEQLRKYIPEEKRYLLSIDEFMKCFYDSRLSLREDNIIFRSFYKDKNQANLKYYEKMKEKFREYYQKHNGNIEYHFGIVLFEEEKADYDLGAIKSLFPALYNIWYIILSEYLYYIELKPYIESFYHSVNNLLATQINIWTTNFDKFADSVLPARHIHGVFVDQIKKFDDVVLYMKNEKEFYFKYIWGHNGYGKHEFINEYGKIPGYDSYFDFSFFMNEDIEVNNLLIYGLGFQKSGWAEPLKEYKEIYKRPFIGGIIDDHILNRIKKLQDSKKIKDVTISYYNNKEKEYFKELIECFGLYNIELKDTKEFNIGL